MVETSGIFEYQTHAAYTRLLVKTDRLDAANAALLKSELVILSGSGVEALVLDMSHCPHCDAEGLNAILLGNRLWRRSGGVFVLTGVSQELERLITVAQVRGAISMAFSEGQVQRHLTGNAS